MGAIRKAVGFCAVLGLVALFPLPVLAADGVPAGWPGWHLQAAFLGLLAPLALILLAAGATPPEDVGGTVAAALSALVMGWVSYVACGFAFQFGGLALRVHWPGLAGLIAEWSPVDPTLGWGAVGLRGFFLAGEAATADTYALAAVQLPVVAMAVLIPTLALCRRMPRGLLVALAALVGGFLYPLAGNWVWGGGWLALLGRNAGLGHGFVDLGGSATVHLLGASVALAGILTLGREVSPSRRRVVELPAAHFPIFMLMGAFLAPAGWLGMILANPLLTPDMAVGLVMLDIVLAGLGGMAPSLFYAWLATGRIDALLAARGLVAGLVAGGAGCGFVPPWAALLIGLLAGTVLPLLLYWVEHSLHWHDPNAALAMHAIPGLMGTLWPALFAEGRWGLGWNGGRAVSPEQGVAGLWVASGYGPDFPGQLYAQLVGLGSILGLALVLSVLVFGLVRGGQAVASRVAALHAPAPKRRIRTRRKPKEAPAATRYQPAGSRVRDARFSRSRR